MRKQHLGDHAVGLELGQAAGRVPVAFSVVALDVGVGVVEAGLPGIEVVVVARLQVRPVAAAALAPPWPVGRNDDVILGLCRRNCWLAFAAVGSPSLPEATRPHHGTNGALAATLGGVENAAAETAEATERGSPRRSRPVVGVSRLAPRLRRTPSQQGKGASAAGRPLASGHGAVEG